MHQTKPPRKRSSTKNSTAPAASPGRVRSSHSVRRPGPRRAVTVIAPPPRDFYRLPELELRGGNLLTDGCRRVLDFTPQRVCLDMGDTLVTLYGEELRIESFAGKRLILAGRFTRVELRSKWEVPPDEG